MAAHSLTSLLNSLHTELQTQFGQNLPTLHQQLGLPADALESELRDVQQKLISSVEESVQAWRTQVDEWLAKCEGVEADCKGYTLALGANVKFAGLGEIRKEHVLPRRFELVSEFQEKLRQLYHTKLEQLTTLTNRIHALARTLGPDFFAAGITEPVVLATDKRDVTPERYKLLEKELVRGKGEVAKRLAQLSASMEQIYWLYEELGMSPPAVNNIGSHDASHDTAVPSSSSASDPFLAPPSQITPTPASRAKCKPITPLIFLTAAPTVSDIDHQRVLAQFVARFEESQAESGSGGLEGVDPTPELIKWVESTCAELEDTKRRREAHIQTMYDQLEGLWRRLGVVDEDMDGFVEAHRGSTDETIQAYEEELERMLELKREKMGTFIQNAREEIERLWDELMIGEAERLDFAPMADDEHTEELLAIHEEEISSLKAERRIKAPLLANIRKYFEICDEEKELAAAAADQTRLLGRGARDTGRLLREEKIRNRVKNLKPRIEADLVVSIPAWEAEADRPFLVHGERIMDLLSDLVAPEPEPKRKATRGGSVPARATTPPNPIHHYVPGSAGYPSSSRTGTVTPAVRPGSSMASNASGPNKRPRLGDSTSATTASRPPLTSHRGPTVNRAVSNNANANRVPSPTKIGKFTASASMSALPRPVGIPRPGTQHHALGHGRIPSAQGVGKAAGHQLPQRSMSAAAGPSSYRSYGSSTTAAPAVSKAPPKPKRESFRPRPSMDAQYDVPATGWRGFAGVPVEEEDEGY